jgi:hypothetical protein
LSSQSDSYPLVGWKTIKDWVKVINIFDSRFNLIILTTLFMEVKQWDYHRTAEGKILPPRKENQKKGMGVGEVIPENELTRANFYDLLVRIAIQKYSKTKKKIGLR